MEFAIETNGLSKDYKKGFWKKENVRALVDLSLNVRPGQIFGFLGGNGAGKTTTIKLLMGLIFPTGGTARILGRDISDTHIHAKIGYCPENPYFYDYLTARELMIYFGELFGFENRRNRKTADELLTRVGLAEKDRHRQLRKFSKGMLQRVGIAQSLVNDPELVVLDEPMSGLDPVGRREMRELIAGLKSAGKTVFMSSHILSDIEALCNNVGILREGRLVATGHLDELLEASGEVRLFEINVKSVSAQRLENQLASVPGAELSPEPSGASIRLRGEGEIERVLAIVKAEGGSLVSVQPVRLSLEELFVKTTSASE